MMSFSKPDIVCVLEREGIELKQRGRNYWALCPFHSEKTPSFKADPDRQNFYCFGCGRRGDVITLVQELHGLSFKDALTHLGINKEREIDLVRVKKQNEKRAIMAVFRKWEIGYLSFCSGALREANKIIESVKTMEEAERLADIYHLIPFLERDWEILFYGDSQDKFNLFKETFYKTNGDSMVG